VAVDNLPLAILAAVDVSDAQRVRLARDTDDRVRDVFEEELQMGVMVQAKPEGGVLGGQYFRSALDGLIRPTPFPSGSSTIA
jgi:hypothetical protein